MESQYLESRQLDAATFALPIVAPATLRHAIIVSDVVPAPTYAASLTMHRHLIERGGFRITQVALKPAGSNSLLEAVHNRLRNSRLHRYVIDCEYIFNSWNQHDNDDCDPVELSSNSFVFTLAHGNGCWAAERFARKHKLPLIVRFDDWWPDMIQAHSFVRHQVERAFRDLYRAAHCAICISEGMQKELGPHPNSRVIGPIPRVAKPAQPIRHQLPLRIGYLGNMNDYGPMLAALVKASDSEKDIRIEFRGGLPRWPKNLVERLRIENRLHSFAEGTEFEDWFESFHVYLVAMFFEPSQRRRVETCFATKLTEYCSLGRPIVIWAPESAAIVSWAKESGAAICVTNPDPNSLVECFQQLANDPARLFLMGRQARKAYETDFPPAKLQQDFLDAVDSVL